MRIYTKTGDEGSTGLFGGTRVSKASLRVDVYGEVDELNSVLGLARAEGLAAANDTTVADVQTLLFNLGAELATSPDSKAALGIALVSDDDVVRLERAIDALESELTPLKTFVLPGGTRAASVLHLARTVCRRAERKLVHLANEEGVRGVCVHYLNRLSDALFVLARAENQRNGVADVPWIGAQRHGDKG
jgi:cob(I)alamin adenosyltransferase